VTMRQRPTHPAAHPPINPQVLPVRSMATFSLGQDLFQQLFPFHVVLNRCAAPSGGGSAAEEGMGVGLSVCVWGGEGGRSTPTSNLDALFVQAPEGVAVRQESGFRGFTHAPDPETLGTPCARRAGPRRCCIRVPPTPVVHRVLDHAI
jgi:hypothetical protein